jgi:hypothetical protein
MITVYSFLRQFDVSHTTAITVQAISSVIACAAVWSAWRLPKSATGALVLVVATFLATPYAFYYDLALLLVPAAILTNVRPLWSMSAGECFGLATIWMLPLVHWVVVQQAHIQVWPLFLGLGLILAARYRA